MIQVQKEIIKRKLKKVLDKDIFSILRATGTLAARQEKAIDIYTLDLQDKSLMYRQGNEDKRSLWREKVEIKILSKEDRTYFEDYLETRKDLLTREFLEDILKLDSCYFLAIQDGRIVGATCLVLKETPLRGGFDLEILFEEDQAYVFQFYIVPEHRGKGLGVFLKTYVIDFCRKQGYKYLVGAMDPSNSRSIHILTELGYKKYVRIVVFDQFLMKWHTFEWFQNTDRGLLKLKLFGKKLVKL
jgi:GNAT superfamily N-acetyltransferase